MAVKVTYWKSIDDSLHPTEKEAVYKDLEILGEDAYYEQTINRVNNTNGKSKSFDYYEIPDKIIYKLIDNGYVTQLIPLVSNPDMSYHYRIEVYKKGIQPKNLLNYIIQPKKDTAS